MYAKDTRHATPPRVTPPRNYGGTAFSRPTPPTVPSLPPAPQSPPEVEPLPPPPKPRSEPSDAKADSEPPVAASASEPVAAPTSSETEGAGLEELLLVALIFLLSREEQDRDTLLMLAMLLLYR